MVAKKDNGDETLDGLVHEIVEKRLLWRSGGIQRVQRERTVDSVPTSRLAWTFLRY